ncbi:MAG TPA: EAL domain-containing protein [Xanthobacteraceae bacterium]|nr:EAL domain-containing protein [Xanthobacteraceae bacterium]
MIVEPHPASSLPHFGDGSLDLLRRPVWVLDVASKRKVYANAAALALWSAESQEELFSRDFTPHSPAIKKRLQDTIDRISRGEVVAERWTFYPKGQSVTVDCLITGVVLADGRIGMMSEAAEPDVPAEERRGVEALRHTVVKVTLYDETGEVLFRNPAAARTYPASHHAFVLSFADPSEGWRVWEQASMHRTGESDAFRGQLVSGVFRVSTADGERWHALDARSTSDPVSGRPCLLVNERDVTDQVKARERIDYLAIHDTVTGLANRGYFTDRLAAAMAASASSQGGVLTIDLDGFKEVNDTFGHAAGDSVLREIGARLRSLVRPDDLCARLGGDEFAVMLPGIADRDELRRRAAQILLRLAQPIEKDLPGHGGLETVTIFASVGAALWPADGDTPEAVQRNADLALYAAKAEGGDGFRYFEPSMRQAVDQRRELIDDLRRGLERGEFEVHFQPLVTLGDMRLAGFEALVRWRHPQRGLLRPDLFLPAAEGAGLMDAIGRVVLELSCRQVRAWLDAGQEPGRIAINLGSGQLRNRELGAQFSATAERYRLEPARFEFEVPETLTLGRGGAEVSGVLQSLRALGFGIALDDFGTGYASLNHLRRLPIDKIKIDRAFIVEMNRSDADLAIVRAVINLGHDLGMLVLAEGIETQAQADTLRGLGCDFAQGYLFGRPMPPADATIWLRSRPPMATDRGQVITFPAGR